MSWAGQQTDTSPEPFHALEAEQALLGAVLMNNEAYGLVSDIVAPEHFHEALHSRIWENITAEITSGGIASVFSIAPKMRTDATMAQVGGPAYLANLISATPTVIGARNYATVVVNAYRRRESAKLAAELQEAITKSDNTSVTSIRSALANLLNGDDGLLHRKRHIKEATESVIRAANDMLANGVVPDTGAHCGSRTLQNVLGSWRRGRFYVLAARPSMGKTSVALSWLLRTAKRSNVLFFSLEMGAEELAQRALTDIAYTSRHRIEYQKIDKGELSDSDVEKLCQAQAVFDDLSLYVDDRAGLTLEQVTAAAMREKQRLKTIGQTLDVICIDHMGIMSASDRYRGNKVQETEELSAGLKRLAKDLDCAVIGLSQLNRDVEKRDEKRPTLSDLRNSGAIEQDADAVMFIYREAYYLERKKCDDALDEHERMEALQAKKNVLEISIAKNRGGSCPVLEFYCDMGCGVVRDLERQA